MSHAALVSDGLLGFYPHDAAADDVPVRGGRDAPEASLILVFTAIFVPLR